MDHFREACQLQICVSLIETVRQVRRELGFDLRKQADMLLQRFKDTMMILFFKVIQECMEYMCGPSSALDFSYYPTMSLF